MRQEPKHLGIPKSGFHYRGVNLEVVGDMKCLQRRCLQCRVILSPKLQLVRLVQCSVLGGQCLDLEFEIL